MIIGIAGYATSGKDEVGKVLTDSYGFERRAFADKIREMLVALDPICNGGLYGNHLLSHELAQHDGDWERVKSGPCGPEVRRLMQRLGTEAGREFLGDDIWRELCLPTFKLASQGTVGETFLSALGNVVVTDVRFPDEVAHIRIGGYSNPGEIWWVSRPGVGPVNSHASDNSLTAGDCDLVVDNSGSLADLRIEVERICYERDIPLPSVAR